MHCASKNNQIKNKKIARPSGQYGSPEGLAFHFVHSSKVVAEMSYITRKGIEPLLSPWKGDVLTTWLTGRYTNDIIEVPDNPRYGRQDSNLRPHGSKPRTLPDCATSV